MGRGDGRAQGGRITFTKATPTLLVSSRLPQKLWGLQRQDRGGERQDWGGDGAPSYKPTCTCSGGNPHAPARFGKMHATVAKRASPAERSNSERCGRFIVAKAAVVLPPRMPRIALRSRVDSPMGLQYHLAEFFQPTRPIRSAPAGDVEMALGRDGNGQRTRADWSRISEALSKKGFVSLEATSSPSVPRAARRRLRHGRPCVGARLCRWPQTRLPELRRQPGPGCDALRRCRSALSNRPTRQTVAGLVAVSRASLPCRPPLWPQCDDASFRRVGRPGRTGVTSWAGPALAACPATLSRPKGPGRRCRRTWRHTARCTRRPARISQRFQIRGPNYRLSAAAPARCVEPGACSAAASVTLRRRQSLRVPGVWVALSQPSIPTCRRDRGRGRSRNPAQRTARALAKSGP